MNLPENVLRDILKQAYQLGCITPSDEKEDALSSLGKKALECSVKDTFTAKKIEDHARGKD